MTPLADPAALAALAHAAFPGPEGADTRARLLSTLQPRPVRTPAWAPNPVRSNGRPHPALPPPPPSLDPDFLIKSLQPLVLPSFDLVRHVQIRPPVVYVDPLWRHVLSGAMVGGYLDLRKLNGRQVDGLTDAQLVGLLDAMASQTHTIRWLPATSRRRKLHLWWRDKRKDVSAASALALQFYARGDYDLADRIFLLRPLDVARDLHHVVPAFFTVDNIAQALKSMLDDLTTGGIDWDYPEQLQADALGNVIEAFLITHARAQPDMVDAWVTALLVKLEEAGFRKTTENLGALTGIIISGGLKYAAWIEENDEKLYRKIDKGAQFAFAASQFTYFVPALTAALSVAAIWSGIALAELFPIRNMGKPVSQVEGKLRIRLLKQRVLSHKYESELGKFLGWIEAMKKANGVS